MEAADEAEAREVLAAPAEEHAAAAEMLRLLDGATREAAWARARNRPARSSNGGNRCLDNFAREAVG
jgi:hypothetical protein